MGEHIAVAKVPVLPVWLPLRHCHFGHPDPLPSKLPAPVFGGRV